MGERVPDVRMSERGCWARMDCMAWEGSRQKMLSLISEPSYKIWMRNWEDCWSCE